MKRDTPRDSEQLASALSFVFIFLQLHPKSSDGGGGNSPYCSISVEQGDVCFTIDIPTAAKSTAKSTADSSCQG